jgi:hypothetical protein
MSTWNRGADMDRAEFAGQIFGRAVGDPVAMGLRSAALTAKLSGSPEALRDAAEHLAGALQAVGLDRLSRFLDDSEAQANEPSTLAALEKSRLPLVQYDAIWPVYPVENCYHGLPIDQAARRRIVLPGLTRLTKSLCPRRRQRYIHPRHHFNLARARCAGKSCFVEMRIPRQSPGSRHWTRPGHP